MEEPKAEDNLAPAAIPEFLSSPGFDQYTTPSNPGFLADFKCIPEDFDVTEISCKNELVVLDRFEAPPLPPPTPRTAESAVIAKPLKGVASCPPDAGSVPELQELVTPDLYQDLQQLALDYKRTLVHDPDQQVELGIINDKGTRSILHLSIRLAFPVLLSITYKNEQGDTRLCVVADSKYKRLLEVLAPDEAEGVLKFVSTAKSCPQSTLMLAPGYSRQHRTQVHQVLSELFGSYVTTKYLPGEQSPHPHKQSADSTDLAVHSLNQSADLPIQSADYSNQSPHLSNQSADVTEQPLAKIPKLEEESRSGIILRLRQKYRNPTPGSKRGVAKSGGGDVFTKFVLKKRNTETLDALQKLGHLVGCSPALFQVSGIKDKRAVTTQEVSVKGVSAESLLQVRDQLDRSGLDIGNFEYVTRHLCVGGHSGNRFRVQLRSLRPKADGEVAGLEGVVDSALRAVESRGFVNYYGLQRFNWSLTMPRVGLAIVRKNPKKAVELVLLEASTLSPQVKDDVRNKRYNLALKALPPDLTRERLLLQKLHQYGHTDYACRRGLMSLPYSVRMLCVHSLSSLLWNHTASFRLSEYGLAPVPGDLVMREGSRNKWSPGETSTLSPREWVHVLSSEDVQNKTYSLQDVVLPVIGSATIYPENRVAERMKVMMAAIGLTAASFRVSWLGMNCPGVYRKLLAYPRNLSWKFLSSPTLHRYTAGHSPLHHSSAGHSSLHHSSADPSPLQHTGDTAEEVGGAPSLKTDALNLEMNFDLDTSVYATMFIREIAKNIY